MAMKPNYGYDKRQKELAKKAKKDEKLKRKQEDKDKESSPETVEQSWSLRALLLSSWNFRTIPRFLEGFWRFSQMTGVALFVSSDRGRIGIVHCP